MRVLVVLTACAVLRADDPPKPRIDLPQAVQAAVDMAQSAPPEFFADVIARLVETGKVPSPQSRIELLESAFKAAAGAHEAIRWKAAFGIPAESALMYRSLADSLRLDTLSLQSGIVRDVLALDPAKAREMFGEILRPSLEPQSCEDPLMPDASAYYEIAGAIAQSGFTSAEKDKGAPVQFLLTALSGTRSPSELAPFGRAAQAVNWSAAEWEQILPAFAAKLDSMEPDSRAFATSISDLRVEVEQLAGRARAAGARTDFLAGSFRDYLVNEMSAPRCSGNYGEATQAVQWFNSTFRGDLPAITDDEIRPSRPPSPAPKIAAYFESGDAKPFGDGLAKLSRGDRTAPDWQLMLADFLRDLDAWRPSGSDTDILHQKAYVLRAVLVLAPPGDNRERILQMCVTLLDSSDTERQAPADWLWEVKAMLQAATGDAPRMIQAFLGTGNAGLILYAQ